MKLFSPYFLLALLLLLLNDHFFKTAYPGFLTGKLSDVAGLFVFSFFFAVWFPKRAKAIYWGTALGFIWWKSSFSNEFIQWWSAQIFVIERVVDYTDLAALTILPISYFVWCKEVRPRFSILSHQLIPLVRMLVMAVSLFAFVATSMPPRYLLPIKDMDITYVFPISETELRKRILDQYSYNRKLSARLFGLTMVQNEEVDSLYVRHKGIWLKPKNWEEYAPDIFEMTKDTIAISLWKPYSTKSIEAQIFISGDDSRSSIQMLLMQGVQQREYGEKREQKAKKIVKRFERKFINRLR